MVGYGYFLELPKECVALVMQASEWLLDNRSIFITLKADTDKLLA